MFLKSAILVSVCSVILAYLFYSEGKILLDRSLAWTKFDNLISTVTDAVGYTVPGPDTTPAIAPENSAPPGPLSPFEIVTPEVPLLINMSVARRIAKKFLAVEKSEGAGAKVRRSIGVPQLRNFSPFLMLDHFSVSSGAGFPDHPHRGQETITYLLSGSVDHEDFAGNKGTIKTGDLQFMTAGKGIMHAEMPGEGPGPNVGLQLWVDLPKDIKYCEPRYRDLRGEEIPTVKTDDGRVEIKVISGNSHGVDSVKDLAYTPVWLLDVTMQPGEKLSQPLPQGWNAFAYVLEGELMIDDKKIEQYNNVVFEQKGDGIEAVVPDNAEQPARFVIVAGTPLDQQVVQYGPFVLNSNEEVYQALMDYQSNSGGFERARGWESQIGRSMLRGR